MIVGRRSFAIVLIVTAGMAARVTAQTPAPTVPQDSIDRGRELVRILLETLELPGLSITVMVGGQVAWSEGFGCANLETGTPATTATKYRIGSVSKLITAATLARLVEEQRFEFDAPVQRYVPDFPDHDAAITARMLAGHLGGIRHYQGDFLNREHYASVTDALSRFRDDPLRHTPGDRYAYSSFGYVLLSAMMEGATGKGFLDLVHEELLVPLGMNSTEPDNVFAIVPDRSGVYTRADGQLRKGAYIDLSDRWAAGGFLSTSEDMARLGAAHLGNRFFSSKTQELLFTSQKTASGEKTNVGIGWRIAEDARGRRYYHHGGSNIGGRAMLAVFPDADVVVSILANLGRAPFGRPEAVTIAELFMPQTGDGSVWDPAGVFDYERTTKEGAVRGTLTLTRTGRGLSGAIRPEEGAEMPVVWTSVRGAELSLVAADPRGQLEIVWLHRDGSNLAGSTWRRNGDFRARRRMK